MALATDLGSKVEGGAGVDAEGEGLGQRGVTGIEAVERAFDLFVDARGPGLEGGCIYVSSKLRTSKHKGLLSAK